MITSSLWTFNTLQTNCCFRIIDFKVFKERAIKSNITELRDNSFKVLIECLSEYIEFTKMLNRQAE